MAWRESTNRHCRPNPIGHLLALIILIVMSAALIAGTEKLDEGLILSLISCFSFGLYHMVQMIQGLVCIRLTRRAWKRVACGDVKQVLVGIALPQMQVAASCPVRTVVVPVAGRARFVRFAFVRGSPQLAPGPVDVDLFDLENVRAPARLRPLNGPVVWAFARRNGDFALEVDPWRLEDGWHAWWPDGWPDSSKHIDPEFDGYSGDGVGGE